MVITWSFCTRWLWLYCTCKMSGVSSLSTVHQTYACFDKIFLFFLNNLNQLCFQYVLQLYMRICTSNFFLVNDFKIFNQWKHFQMLLILERIFVMLFWLLQCKAGGPWKHQNLHPLFPKCGSEKCFTAILISTYPEGHSPFFRGSLGRGFTRFFWGRSPQTPFAQDHLFLVSFATVYMQSRVHIEI